MLCRLCGNNEHNVVPIFCSRPSTTKHIDTKINKYFPIKVSFSDKLPQTICRKCFGTLKSFDELFNNCIEVEVKLKKLLGIQDVACKQSEITENNYSESPADWFEANADNDIQERSNIEVVIINGGTGVNLTPCEVSIRNDSKDVNSEVIAETKHENDEKEGDDDDPPFVECGSCRGLFAREDLAEHSQCCQSSNSKKPSGEEFINCDKCKCLIAGTLFVEHEGICEGSYYKSVDEADTPTVEPKKQKNKIKRFDIKAILSALEQIKPTEPEVNSKFNFNSASGQFFMAKGEVICKLCLSKFPTKFAFISHRKYECLFPHFQCDMCGATFNTCSLLKCHRSYCRKKNKDGSELREKKKPSSIGQYLCLGEKIICQKCNSVFPSKRAFSAHRKNECPFPHFECEHCGATYKSLIPLETHQWKEHGTAAEPCRAPVNFGQLSVLGERVVCKKCNSEFKNVTEFCTHRNNECPFDHFECDACGASFRKHTRLKTHKTLVHSEKIFKCDQCPKSFVTSCTLKIHARAVHNLERPYKCNECPKDFRTRKYLRVHQHIKHNKGLHVDDSSKYLICEKCSKRFRTMFRLQEHMRMHDGTRQVVCELCGKGFYTQPGLKLHQINSNCTQPRIKKLIKPPIRKWPYKKYESPIHTCDHCHKVVRGHRSVLEAHIRVHHFNESPFKCKTCDESFRSQTSLHRHTLKTHRPDFQPHICEVCNKICTSSSELKHHLVTHSSERSLPCPQCKKLYKYQGDLNRHLRKDHLISLERNRGDKL